MDLNICKNCKYYKGKEYIDTIFIFGFSYYFYRFCQFSHSKIYESPILLNNDYYKNVDLEYYCDENCLYYVEQELNLLNKGNL